MANKRQNNERLLLAGDIGATKISLALYSSVQGARRPEHSATFAVEDYATLADLLEEYLSNTNTPAQAACFGVAGPVIERKVQMTNHNWLVDAAELEASFGFAHVWLLNDLKATANAVPLLTPDELHTLAAGQPDPEGNIAVIAPGTGLGEGYLARDGAGYSVHAGEGGHSDFAPRTELQRELLEYLRQSLDQVSVEDVCSGIGMPNVYRFLRNSGRANEPDWLAEKLAEVEDPTPLIFEAALDQNPPEICKLAVQVFVSILGYESANLVLKIGATGGLYLGGGIPPKILDALRGDVFLDAFFGKRLYRRYMQRIPVHVILNADSGMLGAADFGLTRMLTTNSQE